MQNVLSPCAIFMRLLKINFPFLQTFRLLHEEGFYVGASSGLNVVGAVTVARDMGPGHTVVTCLCDTGQRYFTRLYSKSWLESKGLLDFVPAAYRKSLIP